MTWDTVGPEMMAPVAGKSAEPVHYKLHGVLYHHGEQRELYGQCAPPEWRQ